MPNEYENKLVIPPKYKRLPSRPKKVTHKKFDKTISSRINFYGRFDHQGHNRRTRNFF